MSRPPSDLSPSLGLAGIDHVGITVPDIEQAIAWFEDVLGAEATLTFGPIAAGARLAAALGVAESASIEQITTLRIGPGAGIELLQYAAPDGQRRDMPANSDWSGRHVAFYVEEMDAAVAYIEGMGVERMPGDPRFAAEQKAAGEAIQYFRTPWGGYLEFVSYPSPQLKGEKPEVTKVPGLLGVDHVGITVPRIELAASWLEANLGFTELSRFGPIGDSQGELMRRLVDVHPRAVIEQIRMLGASDGPNVELFQYASPDQDRRPRLNSDWGAHHLGFFVDDIEIATAALQESCGSRRDGPLRTTEGPAAGRATRHFETPFGSDVELISHPDRTA